MGNLFYLQIFVTGKYMQALLEDLIKADFSW